MSMWRKHRKEKFKGGDGTDLLTPCAPSCFFPPFLNMVAMLQQWMETSQENVATAPFSPFPIFPSYPSILSLVFHDTKNVTQHFPPLLHSLSSSFLSPTLLLLPSQVASRVRAGFAEAPVCWQHTVTDLIAERRKPTEPQCKTPFAETCNVAIWVPDFPQIFDPTVRNIQDLWVWRNTCLPAFKLH